MTTMLSPRAEVTVSRGNSGPDAGPLAGKRVGVRLDDFWESWNWVADEWKDSLTALGAQPVLWRAPVVRGEEEVVRAAEEFRWFLGNIDVAIVGLCNCGSCTLWAIHDALATLDCGLPTVAIATEHFARLARILSEKGGRPDIRMTVLPYPLEGRPEPEVREIARASFEQMLKVLGATVA
jgi:hypothetical protein